MRIFILMVLALILTASWQQALAEEVCLEGDTVMGIKGLDVLTDSYGPRTIDVKFTYATGYEVYSSGLDNFPFNEANKEEDLIAMNAQINASLGANNPTPGSAGQPDQNVYFIGAEEDEGLIGAYGSENFAGFWEPCRQLDDCILGVAILNPNDRHTYAELSSTTGGKCGNSPPDETGSYDIVPCISGSWFLPERDGEGYVIEILGPSLEPEMLAYFYTYDDAGKQMWMLGQGFADGDTAVLPVQVTSGPVYGDDYDKDDVLREDWGTLTFKFTSKDAGTVVRASTMGFGTTTVDIERLSYLTDLVCD